MNDIYAFTVPIFIKSLEALGKILAKAGAFAAEGKIAEAALLESRLAPDMFPLMRQVQVACDNAKGSTARLTGTEAPKYEDTEKTIAELQERIGKTVAFLKSVSPEQFKGAEERQVTLPYFPGKFLTGFDYAREYALPNFFFHVTTAYAIVRMKGVVLGKADYINGLPLKDL
jgi:hypothetical protein